MSNKVADKAGYVALSGIFNIILAIFCWRRRPDQIGMRDWGLLALATFRLSRMLAYDKVMEAYRSPVVETVPHDSGAGLTTQAHSDATGFKKAMGEISYRRARRCASCRPCRSRSGYRRPRRTGSASG
jgi:hypothetical protein